MRSMIDASDCVENTERRFGADTVYYPVRLYGFGELTDALFTKAQIEAAALRAQVNKEDVPKRLTFMELLWKFFIR